MTCVRWLCILLLMASVGRLAASDAWTVLVYLAGDNDLEPEALLEFQEIASVGSTDAVNLVVQIDRSAGFEKTFGNWSGTRRGRVVTGAVPDAGWGSAVGSLDMSDPATLTAFIQWGVATYPADRYAVVLFDHGYGVSGMCSDSQGDGLFSTMAPDEVRQALAESGVRFELVGHMLCYGAMVEQAVTYAPFARYLVASQQQIQTPDCWPWDDFLDDLVANPQWTGTELGTAIVNAYGLHYGSGGSDTLSQIDLGKVAAVDGFQHALNHFANCAMLASAADRSRLGILRNSQVAYYMGSVDIGRFLHGVIADSTIDARIRAAAQTAFTAYQAAVIANFENEAMGDGRHSGLQIFLPFIDHDPNWYAIPYDHRIQFADFHARTSWDEFLLWWHTGARAQLTGAAVTGSMGQGADFPRAADSLVITFDKPMATGSFSITEHITAFIGPGGDLRQSITGASWSDSRTLVITFASQGTAGTYSLRLSPDIWDSWSNAMDHDGDGINGETVDDAAELSFTLSGSGGDAAPIILRLDAEPATVVVP